MVEVKGKSSPTIFRIKVALQGPIPDRPEPSRDGEDPCSGVSGLECSGEQLLLFLPLLPVVLTSRWTPNPEAPHGSWCSGTPAAATAPLESVSPTQSFTMVPEWPSLQCLFFQGYFKHISSFFLVFNSSFQIECYLYSLPIVVKSSLTSFILPLTFQFVTLQFSLVCSFWLWNSHCWAEKPTIIMFPFLFLIIFP